MPGLVAEKLGMTEIFSKSGVVIPVTVLRAGPCLVVMKKIREKDRYNAIQIGFDEVSPKRRTKPYGGHFVKRGLKVQRLLKEIRTEHPDLYQPGDLIPVACLAEGDLVDAQGISKGKGFQGVMKRHHFAGGRASHGCSVSHRSAGSIGQRTWPGKVFKGKRMAGQMGNETVTVRNLQVVSIDAARHLVLLRGAVPGATGTVVTLKPAGDFFEKRFGEQKAKSQAREVKPAKEEEGAAKEEKGS